MVATVLGITWRYDDIQQKCNHFSLSLFMTIETYSRSLPVYLHFCFAGQNHNTDCCEDWNYSDGLGYLRLHI